MPKKLATAWRRMCCAWVRAWRRWALILKSPAGIYVFVANGSMLKDGQELPLWSMSVVESNEAGFEIRAGSQGLEALILQYPREDE